MSQPTREWIVRRAVESDLEALARLNDLVHAPHVDQDATHFRPTVRHEVIDWFAQRLASPTTPTWVGAVDADPIGYLTASLVERPATPFTRPRRLFDLDHIVVARSWRGTGVARALIEALLEEARTQGGLDVELTSWDFNCEAHEAFERLGFRRVSARFARRAG